MALYFEVDPEVECSNIQRYFHTRSTPKPAIKRTISVASGDFLQQDLETSAICLPGESYITKMYNYVPGYITSNRHNSIHCSLAAQLTQAIPSAIKSKDKNLSVSRTIHIRITKTTNFFDKDRLFEPRRSLDLICSHTTYVELNIRKYRSYLAPF